MNQHNVIEHKTLEITNVQYFQAKLAFEMTPWSLKDLLDKTPDQVCLLDVRAPEHFLAGHIPTALNVPLAKLVSKLKTLPKGKLIVTYCSNLTCGLAPKAALELAQKGFKVMQLMGGMATWQEQGFPVAKKA